MAMAAHIERRTTMLAGFDGEVERADGLALARALEPLTCARLELDLRGYNGSDVPDPDHACLVVLGAPKHGADDYVGIGRIGEGLLYGGACSVALAPKGFGARRNTQITSVGAYGCDESPAVQEAADFIAHCAGGSVHDLGAGDRADIDLLVIGSAPYAPKNRVVVDEEAEWLLRSATCPVLVLPRRFC
jgi:hypothetical protein